MTDRIACVNPRCRRTAPVEKFGEGAEIVCSKCWKTLPTALVRRYRSLRARDRKIDRLVARKRHQSPMFSLGRLDRMGGQIDRLMAANWLEIRAFFYPVEKPEGLDTFLEEVGL